MHRQPGQLLQRVEHLALAAHQLGQVAAAVDAHDRAVALDVQIDVAVEVQQVQQLLEVVAGDLALGHQSLLEILSVRRGALSVTVLARPPTRRCVRSSRRPSCLSLPHPPDTAPVNVSASSAARPGAVSLLGAARRCPRTARARLALRSTRTSSPSVAQLGHRRLRIATRSSPARSSVTGLRLARSLRLGAGWRRVRRPPLLGLDLLRLFLFLDLAEHVVLLAEGPDVVREPVEDDRQRQERSADHHAEREHVQRQPVHHRGLRVGRRLRALPRDRRPAVEVRRDAGRIITGTPTRDHRGPAEFGERIQAGRLNHRRAQRRAEQVRVQEVPDVGRAEDVVARRPVLLHRQVRPEAAAEPAAAVRLNDRST